VTKAGVGTNRFSYSFNDPVNKFDPGGNDWNPMNGDEFDPEKTPPVYTKRTYIDDMTDVLRASGRIAYDAGAVAASIALPDFQGLTNGDLTWNDALEVASIVPVGKVAKWAVRASRTTSTLTGTVKVVSEAMSPRARAYQARVTGMAEGTAYVQNGVKFDGYDEAAGLLIDAKYGMDFMVDSAGSFKSWSRLPDKVIDQAKRQLDAAGDASVEWRFSDERVALAVRDLFSSQNLAINVVHVP
jgi:hypothetical protein